jgi:polyhydroxyalkanoate synthase
LIPVDTIVLCWRRTIIEHPGEIGVGLPHVGMLVGRAAYARVWPQIVAWLKARS